MKIFLLLFVIMCTSVYGSEKVIYGDDNRLEPYVVEGIFHELSKSSAAMIKKEHIKSKGFWNKKYFLEFDQTLRDRGICDQERFSDQQSAAKCSGFLVGKDILVTAGHCVYDSKDCRRFAWVFDYTLEEGQSRIHELKKRNIYHCDKIIKQVLDTRGTKVDYAVIKLDRKVKGRTPLKTRKSGMISDSAELVVIGSPSGVPTKITFGGKILDNSNPYFFSTNLDVFSGNSGAAVFNMKSGEVEGILVRGEEDYIIGDNQCQVIRQCPENGEGCRGEDVTRIAPVLEYIPKK